MNSIEWREGNIPVSTRFDDPYYSRENGRSETAHVFINGNQLVERWANMEECQIAELGFGTGLNFLETVQQWNQVKPANSHLHFVSFEQFPMERSQIHKALSAWPELEQLAARFLSGWKPEPEGSMKMDFDNNTCLEVHFSDANVILPKLSFRADAWYLDGFSPAKNPQLWNAELMQSVFDHTVAEGTFATYSSAGFVRRNLLSAGFSVEKIPGFGKKREMLIGRKPNDIDVASEH